MLKKSLLFAGSVLLAQTLWASPLSPEAALQRAVSHPEGKRMAAAISNPVLAFTQKSEAGIPAVYVFNKAQDSGILLLSADDAAMPILGYTDSGTFDAANIPPQMEYWMNEYAKQIAYAAERGVKASATTFPTSWSYVAPLVRAQWNQMAPYNQQVPTQGTTHYPTGCVATAMAQIMDYWKYPEVGVGSITYVSNGTSRTMNFTREKFDWANMLDVYLPGKYNETQANAVSYLMKACAYSAKMNFAMAGSGTQYQFAAQAFRDYFSYDSSIDVCERYMFADMDWNQLVYDQVSKVGPVLYSGASAEGGHAFVVDGYDGNGYFHLNWGWGGLCNGYYLLSALNPTQTGTGGGSYGGYNFGQSIVYNIMTPGSRPASPSWSGLAILGNLSATMSGTQMTFSLSGWEPLGIINDGMRAYTVRMGIEITPVGGGNATYVECTTPSVFNIAVATYLDGAQLKPVARFSSNLGNGTYKVRLVWKNTVGGGASWKYFNKPQSCYDYVYVTRSGDNYTVQNFDQMHFKISSAEIISPLYYGNPCKIKFNISNENAVPITQTVIPSLYSDNVLAYTADSQLVSLNPGETTEVTLVYTFIKTDQGKTPSTAKPITVQLGAMDHTTGYVYGKFGTYDMYRSSANYKMVLDDMKITNGEVMAPINDLPTFGINNPRDIKLDVAVTLTGNNAFLATPITAVISEYDVENRSELSEVFEKEFDNLVYLSGGDSANETTSINFAGFNSGKVYNLSTYYKASSGRVLLGTIRLAAGSGVEGIVSDASGLSLGYSGKVLSASAASAVTITVYDLNGVAVAAVSGDSVEIDTASLAPGIYVAKAVASDGSVKTIKIRR